MATRNKKKKTEKKTKRFTLLDIEYQKSSSTGGNVDLPVVIDLEDDDPYKFVGTQSLEVETGYATPSKPPSRKPATPQRPCDGSTAAGVSMKGGGTPQLKQATPKTKKSPGSSTFTESERLRVKEEEELKRAIEASLQEHQREDRLRRRKEKEEENEQNEIYQSIQKEIKKVQPIITDTESSPTAGVSKSIVCGDGHEQTADVDIRHSQSHSALASRVLPSSQQLKSVSVKKLSMKSVRSKKRDSEQLETIGEAVTTTTTIIAEAPEMMTVSASESSVVKEECSKESEKNEEEHDVQVISGDEDATPPLSVDISLQNKLIHEDDDTWDFEVTSFVKTAGVGSAKKDRRPDAEMDISVEDNVDVSNCQLNKESPKLTVSSGVPNNDHNDTTALSTENVKTRPEYKPVRKSRSNLLRLTKDRKRGLGVSYQETNTPHLSEEPAAKRQKMETDTDDNKDECNVPKVVENKEPRLVEQSSQDCSIVEPTVDQSPHKADSTHTDQKLGKELQEETPKVKLISAGKITPKKQLTTGLGVRKQLKLSTNAPQSQQKSNNSPSKFPTVKGQTTVSDVIASLPSAKKKSVYHSRHMVSDFSNDSTPDIVQKFDSYFARLAGAQRKVLWRLKSGKPITVAKKSSSSLIVDRSRRVLRSNVVSPLSVLELKTRRKTKPGHLSRQPPPPPGETSIGEKKLGDDANTNDTANTVTLAQEIRDTTEKSNPPDEEMDTHEGKSPRVGDACDQTDVNAESGEELMAMSPPTHAAGDTTLLSDDQQQRAVVAENKRPTQPPEPTKKDEVENPATTSMTASHLPLSGSDSDIDFVDFMEFAPKVRRLRDRNDIIPSSPSTLSQSSVTNAQEIAQNDVIVISTQNDAPALTVPASDSAFDKLLSQTHSPSPDPIIPSEHTDSESDDIAVPTKTSSSLSWLCSRKRTPVSLRKKIPTKRKVKTKSQTTSSNGKDKQCSAKPLSAAARMRTKSALVIDEDCTSETMSSGEEAPAITTRLKHRRHSKQFLTLNDSSDEDIMKSDSPRETTEHVQQRRGTGGKNKAKKGSVIDLTADTQITMDSSPSPSPSEELVECPICQRRFSTSTIQAHAAHCNTSTKVKDNCQSCPMCKRWFDVKIIRVHAEQCNGIDSDKETSTAALACSTSSSTARGRSSAVGGKGVRQHRYEPSLRSPINKQKELDDIESSETETEGERMEDEGSKDGQHVKEGATSTPLLDELEAALESAGSKQFSEVSSVNLDSDFAITPGARSTPLLDELEAALESAGSKQASEVSSVDLDSDFATTATKELLAIPCPDGGYMIDPSAVSSSPVRSFKKISELDPKERASFQNQFTSKGKRRGVKKSHQGPSSGMSREERVSSTWGRDDFDSLFESSRGGGRGRRGGGGRGMPRGRSYRKWRYKRRGF